MNKVRPKIQFSMSSLVLLLTIACVGVGIYATRNSSIKVLVATENLDYKTAITKANAKFEKWPASIVPDGAITASDKFPAGDVITTRLRKGQVIIGEDVIDPAKLPGLAIPRNHCVRNFKVPALRAALRPGDRVDVVVAPNDDDGNLKSVCKGVRVFNIGSSTLKNGTSMIVGVLLHRDQVTLVTDAKADGQIRLVPRDDSRLLE